MYSHDTMIEDAERLPRGKVPVFIRKRPLTGERSRMFTKVLVPLDGSEVAEGILPYVSTLAKGLDISLMLLTVLHPDSIEGPVPVRPGDSLREVERWGAGPLLPTPGVPPTESPGGPYRFQFQERAQQEAEGGLGKVAKRLVDQGVRTQAVASLGRAAEEIVEVAERERCDLIAMSTHGRRALGRGVLGSVTDRVLHSTNLPVLAITPEKAREHWEQDAAISKILVPLDGSDLAETVLPYVEELARALSLEVVLVRVSRGSASTPYSAALLYADGVDLDAKIDARNREYLEGIAERLRAKRLEVQLTVLKGAPAYAILETAKKTSGNIIALTTRGRSGFTRWTLGSVAEALVRASGDPVLVIPPKVPAEAEK